MGKVGSRDACVGRVVPRRVSWKRVIESFLPVSFFHAARVLGHRAQVLQWSAGNGAGVKQGIHRAAG